MHVLIVTTFNDSLMRAKLLPLLRTKLVDRVTVVSRRDGPALPGVSYVVARDDGRVARRTLSLAATALQTAARVRPDLVMAYNILPFGVVALLTARFARVPLGLNIIGGPVEFEGGGIGNDDNRFLARRKKPSHLLERALLAIVRRADFVTT